MASRNPSTISNEQALLNMIKIFLPDLEIELRDLKNPTPPFVLNFYAAFLSELEVNVHNLSQIQLNQMTLISHVDMYNQTIPHANIFKAIDYFAKHIGINDFRFSDMMNPDPKRTYNHLSAFMNFLEYCDTALHDLSPEIESLQLHRKKINEIQSKIETVKRDINSRATNRVQRAERIKDMEKEKEKLKKILDEQFKDKETLKPTMEGIKKLVLQDEERELQYARAIKDLEEELEKLEGMIVKSPDKLKNELKHLQERQQESIEKIKSLKSQIEEKKRLSNRFLNERNEQETRLQLLKEILEFEKSVEEKEGRLDIIKKKHDEYSDKVEDSKLQIRTLSQQLNVLKTNLEELKARRIKQEAEMKEPLALAEKEYRALVAINKEKMERHGELKKKLHEIRDRRAQLEKDREKFDEFFKKESDSLNAKGDEIRDRFDKILEAARRRNQRLLEDDEDL